MWGLRGSPGVRSLFARFTLLSLAVVVLALLPGGLLTAKAARGRDAASWWESGREAAPAVAQRVRTDRLGGPAKSRGSERAGGDGPAGEMPRASSAARRMVPLGVAGPLGGEQTRPVCPDPREGCLLPAVVRALPEQVSPVRQTVQRVVDAVAGLLDVLLVLQAVVLVTLSVWAVRRVVRHRMRPVREICAALERINNCGEGRIAEPRGQDDIARLAGTINTTLDQLRQMRKFTSDVSHELRTPLTALRLHVEELQLNRERVDLDEMLRQGLRNIERLEEIINDLLLLARPKEGPGSVRPAPVDLGELVREEAGPRPGRIPIKLDIKGDVWVLGVRTQLQRVVRNLLDNAQRHAISAIRITVGESGGAAELAVADDGHGVPMEDRERIFERFVRLEESRRLDPGGTGLGLAISREIARAHGGTLHVEDSWNGGACFLLRLPLSAARRRELPPEAPVERVARGAPSVPGAQMHIRWSHMADGRQD